MQLLESYRTDEVEGCPTINQDVVQPDGGGDDQWQLPSPTMFLGQSKAMKPMDVSIHLWWGASLGAGAAAATATAQRSVLTTCLDIMSQEPPYMMQSCLWCSSVLESESEWL
jgi:hypothetical protein